MRDFGFGVLQTARLRSSSPGPLFSGGADRPYAAGAAAAASPSASATPFGPLSPPPLPVTGFSEAASPLPIPFGCGGADSSTATASSSSPFPVHQQTMQDELLLRLTQQPARPLSGAEATEKLPNHHPGGGTNAGVTHLLPSQDFKPSLHHPSSSASSCCCCRTSSPQDFSKRQQQQQLSSQKRKEFSPPRLPHPPDSKPPPPLHCPGRFGSPPPPGQLLQPAQLAQRQPQQQQQQQQFSLPHPQHLPPQDFAPQQRPADLPPLPQLQPSPPAAPRRRHGGAGSPRKTPAVGEGSAAEPPNAGLAPSTPPVNPAPGSMESPNHPLLNSPSNLLPGGALGAGAFSSLQSPDLPHPGGGGGGGSSGGGGPPGGGGGGGSASPPPPLPGFGTPWSVQTVSAMPPPSPDSENGFYPGLPSSMNPAFFPSFSPVSPHGCAGLSVPAGGGGGGGGGFGGPFSAAAVPPPPPPAMNLPQQQQPPPPAAPQQPQSRRSPVSPQLQQQHQAAAAAFLQQRNSYNHHQPLLKQSPWSNHQSSGWGTGSMSWGAMHGRDHRRTGNMGIPGTMNQISPLKKPFSGNVIAPPKFTRSTPSLTPKSWIEDNVFRTDNNSNTLLPLQVRSSLQLPAWGSDSLQDSWCTAAGTSRIDQDRSRMYDSLNMHSLENSLIDIMRAEHDPLKGRLSYPHPGTDNLLMLNARSYGRRRGRSSLFPIDDGLLDDGHNDQVGVLNSPTCYSAHQNGERIERFSRKVFVGGLPPDIDEDEITASFRRFGPLVVDWPHKAESKSYFPPKGYAFLLFQEESSVQALIDACIEEDGKLYLCVSSPTIKDKPVQIRPWNLSDSDFVMDGSQPLDPRKTIFVGGVPRPLRAVELAMIMDRLYGGVCYAGIDTDPELKYPKGAGRVAFSNQQSYIAAISARFVQLQHGDIDKRVEVKPYVLDDQMCDECQGARCGGKFAPFFCANVTCLQYYCEFCWANIHSRAGREFHKPLVKEGADRPRQIHFRWN
ncbi:cytoplasmic polyadenylation element-binding protein 2 isoform X1 [Physeter macrocephalus]|uniref:Cytoplasmic polyadenylation element-binding protein 2 isoform X1 n=1 Tax=Physeter macrocephalus TaxID=9755 RepID=A0A2Y9SFG4_PHYMC|nr:cytoplasmic polyadenylation element-binding protein 2 isoform X1 [Physeter catodon]|eukprot:XP_023975055.1 cytoplasmic polyadenylation element-binding protein 2 isoform X1 [Physeter catodon]